MKKNLKLNYITFHILQFIRAIPTLFYKAYFGFRNQKIKYSTIAYITFRNFIGSNT